jgi:hypothetical protein
VDDEAADPKVDRMRRETSMMRVREAPVPPKGGDAMSVAGAPRPSASMAPSSSKDKRRYEGPVAHVLADEDLLGCIFGFLRGMMARQSVKALGQLGLVCRTWRKVACWEKWWAGIRKAVMPGRGMSPGTSARTHLMQYGRMLVEERRVWRFDNWTDGLEMHFEVFDRRDGMQLLSARGSPIFCREAEHEYELQLRNDESLYLWSPLFSPKDRGCEDISAFTERTWWHDDDPGLCVRVSMSDRRTGRRVLLWDEGKGTSRDQEEDPYDMEGRFLIVSHGTAVVQSNSPHLKLECSTSIVLWPESDEEEVAEQDKLYSIIGGGHYEDGEGPLRLIYTGDDVLRVPSWIKSLLAMES